MTPFPIVTNAGPLIYLSVLNRFTLLQQLFATVWLPQAVYQEVIVHGQGLPGTQETRDAVEAGWLKPTAVKNRIAVDALLNELDLGEAEAIVLARELEIDRVLLDDGAARTRARLMGLGVSGTIGVLLLARRTGLALDLRHDLDVLIEHNFRLSRQVYDALVAVEPPASPSK